MKVNKKKNKLLHILIISCCITFSLIGGINAYLSWSGANNNTFTGETSVNPSINETFNGITKEKVSISVGETGYSVYVRAMLVINWQNGTAVLAKAPIKDTDYSLTLNLTDDGWFLGDDGFYYYNQPVNSGGKTEILISECTVLKEAPQSGYTLNVEVITQTIQAAGSTDADNTPLVEKVWDVMVNNDLSLSKK